MYSATAAAVAACGAIQVLCLYLFLICITTKLKITLMSPENTFTWGQRINTSLCMNDGNYDSIRRLNLDINSDMSTSRELNCKAEKWVAH